MQPSRAWFLILLGVFALERIAELALTKKNLARTRDWGAAGRANYLCMVGVHTALIVVPALEVVALDVEPVPALFWGALAVLALSQTLRWWAIASLGRAWNARAVVDPSLGFVQSGPYRWMRHPNYLAVVLEFLALPLAGSAWISWIVLNLVHAPVLARRIAAEDRLLFAVPGYASAMGSKGGILPRGSRAS